MSIDGSWELVKIQNPMWRWWAPWRDRWILLEEFIPDNDNDVVEGQHQFRLAQHNGN